MSHRDKNPPFPSQVVNSLKPRVFYGWWIVALGSLILAVGGGILSQCFTIFFLPLKRDFGVSSAAISLLYGAARLEGGIEGPVIGHLIDRFGPRALMIAGITMAGVGLILLSLVDHFWSFFIIYVAIVSLGYNAGFFHPVYTAVNNWFIGHRGVGLACVTASSNVGGIIMAPFLSLIVLNSGWRVGVITAGVIILVVGLPAALRVYRSPEVMGLHPDGEAPDQFVPQTSSPKRPRTVDFDFTVKEALNTRTYWLLMVAISLRLSVTVALMAHFIPILVWKGMNEATGAYLVSLYAFVSILMTLGMGWLGDRWNKSLLCSLGIIPTVAALFALIFIHASFTPYFFPVGLAITMAVTPLNWALVGDFYGRRSYATLRGIMGVCYGMATFLSPIYGGWVHDRTGSYTLVLLTFSAILVVAALLFATLRHPSMIRPSSPTA